MRLTRSLMLRGRSRNDHRLSCANPPGWDCGRAGDRFRNGRSGCGKLARTWAASAVPTGLVGFKCGNPRLKSWAIVGRPSGTICTAREMSETAVFRCFGVSVAKRCRHRQLPIEPSQPMDLVSELEKGTGFQPSLCFFDSIPGATLSAFPQAGMKPRRWR